MTASAEEKPTSKKLESVTVSVKSHGRHVPLGKVKKGSRGTNPEILKLKESEAKKPDADHVLVMDTTTNSSSNSADRLVFNITKTSDSTMSKPPKSGDSLGTSLSGQQCHTADGGRSVPGDMNLPNSSSSLIIGMDSSGCKLDVPRPEDGSFRQPGAPNPTNQDSMTNLTKLQSGLLISSNSSPGSVNLQSSNIKNHQRSASSPAAVDLSSLLPATHAEVGTNASVEQWSVEDVGRWLAWLGWKEDVTHRFEAQQVTGEVLLSLNEHDFKEELQLQLLGERRSLALAIARLKSPQAPPVVPQMVSPSASPPSSGSPHSSPQHSPVTHHHYYHHSPPTPHQQQQQCYCYASYSTTDNGAGHHLHQYSSVLATDNISTNSAGDNTTNGGDSGIGGAEWEAPPAGAAWCTGACGGPACHQNLHHPTSPHMVAQKLLKQQRRRHRCKTRRHYYSSDSDDEAEEDEDDKDDDKDNVPDMASKTIPSGAPGTGPGASLGSSRRGTAGGGGGYRTAPRLRPEYIKTAISCFYMFLVTWITAIVMVFVHDRVPDRARHPPLPDIFLDNVPHIPWAFQLCEVTIIILTCTLMAILCFHKHRCIIMRRFAALSGTVFLLRCATMFITSLSVPGSHLQCSPRERRSVWRQVEQAWVIWQGGGLSIKGVRTCGDYMFSGHTTALTMLNFFITEYTPRRMYYVHISSWVLNMFGVFFVLAAHEHYSIDVFIAFYITSRMFLYYHSLANNRALHQRDSFRTKIWFPMFSFFESNIDGIVPNDYSNPFAVDNLFWAAMVGVTPFLWLLDRGKVALIALSGIAGWRDLTRIAGIGGLGGGNGSGGGSDGSVREDNAIGKSTDGISSQVTKPSSENSVGGGCNARTTDTLQSGGDVSVNLQQNTSSNNITVQASMAENISADTGKCSGCTGSSPSTATRCRGPTLMTTHGGPVNFNLQTACSKNAGNSGAMRSEKSEHGSTNKKKSH